jgi:hypothetical protein
MQTSQTTAIAVLLIANVAVAAWNAAKLVEAVFG